MCKSQIIESLLKKIFQTVERILANSETITSPSFYLLTPSGMERLESTCMLLIAIGEGVKGVDNIQVLSSRSEEHTSELQSH